MQRKTTALWAKCSNNVYGSCTSHLYPVPHPTTILYWGADHEVLTWAGGAGGLQLFCPAVQRVNRSAILSLPSHVGSDVIDGTRAVWIK